MKIKKGDQVQVITGKYKGTIGEVTAAFPKENKLIVEGVKIVKRAVKPSQANPEGGIVEKQLKIDASNVMAYDAKAKKASRIGYTMEKGEKVRIYKKSGNKMK